jgi:Lsr2
MLAIEATGPNVSSFTTCKRGVCRNQIVLLTDWARNVGGVIRRRHEGDVMARVLVPAHEEWTDDLDGSPASRTIELKTDEGSRYRIDLSKANYADWIAPLVRAGTRLAKSGRPAKKVAARRSATPTRKKSAYQKLSARDRTAIREYLGRGTSRGLLANAEVETWIASGKPKTLAKTSGKPRR